MIILPRPGEWLSKSLLTSIIWRVIIVIYFMFLNKYLYLFSSWYICFLIYLFHFLAFLTISPFITTSPNMTFWISILISDALSMITLILTQFWHIYRPHTDTHSETDFMTPLISWVTRFLVASAHNDFSLAQAYDHMVFMMATWQTDNIVDQSCSMFSSLWKTSLT